MRCCRRLMICFVCEGGGAGLIVRQTTPAFIHADLYSRNGECYSVPAECLE